MPAGRSSVDVLKLIDLNRDVVGGKWERVPTSPALTVSGLLGLVQIPLALPVEYTLTVDVTRLARPTPLVAILPLPGRQCYVVVDSGETGLGLIDGEVANTNETSSNETRLKENKKATVVYRVTRAAITVAVDGKTVINFTGDFARLTLAGSRGYSLPSQMALGIGANGNGKLEISRIEVAPAD